MSGLLPKRGVNASSDATDATDPTNASNRAIAPIISNIYQEHPAVTEMTEAMAAQWRKENDLQVLGREPPKPVLSFDHAPFHAFVRQRLASKYSQPSSIQAQGWPVALAGRDMIGSAQTGSGKTLCFILPALEHIAAQKDRLRLGDPLVLVLAPTRELALQVYEAAREFADGYNVRVACVHGGQGNRMQQIRDLRVRPALIVATPGRLLDFVSMGIISLRNVSMWVLDEADMMLDMGFEPQVRAIDEQISRERQVLMWSATWPRKIQDLSADFLKDPVRVRAGADELTVNKQVKQTIEFLEAHERMPRLLNLLESAADDVVRKVLIFVSQKVTAEWLTDSLVAHLRRINRPLVCGALHGEVSQPERKRILDGFRSNRVNVLVATNVAARGLDISDVSLVLNYDFPAEIDQYIHRIGRTGRAGRTGEAVSFFTPDDYDMVDELVDVMRRGNQEIPPELRSIKEELERKRRPSSSRMGQSRSGSRPGSRPSRGNFGSNRGGQSSGRRYPPNRSGGRSMNTPDY
jgi:ATP-dependent RNA helicase DDX5/DBP2